MNQSTEDLEAVPLMLSVVWFQDHMTDTVSQEDATLHIWNFNLLWIVSLHVTCNICKETVREKILISGASY
jgi:hypothetical protein